MPRFVAASFVAAVVSLVLCFVVAWQVQRFSDAESRRDCERAVAVRDDGRAMWLYLVDTADSDPKRVAAFVKVLNERLPQLECRGGIPVPVKPKATT